MESAEVLSQSQSQSKEMKPKHTTIWITPTLHNELLTYTEELQEQRGGKPVTFAGAIEHLLKTAPSSTVRQRQERRRGQWRPARRLKEE